MRKTSEGFSVTINVKISNTQSQKLQKICEDMDCDTSTTLRYLIDEYNKDQLDKYLKDMMEYKQKFEISTILYNKFKRESEIISRQKEELIIKQNQIKNEVKLQVSIKSKENNIWQKLTKTFGFISEDDKLSDIQLKDRYDKIVEFIDHNIDICDIDKNDGITIKNNIIKLAKKYNIIKGDKI